ncbi:unnamed protein product [Phyllotreta striolata]|uniref:Uncharacterized protein n=1 Tax=Phyllotreta striolata TaxID=444603 RepID=A0A9P0E0P7_PHYSR|nr:unnamed protein product [Phyllotreta striolata]
MDPAQFKLLMEAFQQQQQALIKEVSNQFQAQIQTMVQSTQAQQAGLTDKTKIGQLLCASIGSDHYNSMEAFLGPDNPLKSLDYDILVGEFKKMLIPK